MKTKVYVGIALIVFFVCLIVIFGAGFTQLNNYALNTQTQNQVVVDKNQVCTVNSTDCQIGNTTNNNAAAGSSTNSTTPSTDTGNMATTPTPVATPQPTSTYISPPPAPRRRVVTRAS